MTVSTLRDIASATVLALTLAGCGAEQTASGSSVDASDADADASVDAETSAETNGPRPDTEAKDGPEGRDRGSKTLEGRLVTTWNTSTDSVTLRSNGRSLFARIGPDRIYIVDLESQDGWVWYTSDPDTPSPASIRRDFAVTEDNFFAANREEETSVLYRSPIVLGAGPTHGEPIPIFEPKTRTRYGGVGYLESNPHVVLEKSSNLDGPTTSVWRVEGPNDRERIDQKDGSVAGLDATAAAGRIAWWGAASEEAVRLNVTSINEGATVSPPAAYETPVRTASNGEHLVWSDDTGTVRSISMDSGEPEPVELGTIPTSAAAVTIANGRWHAVDRDGRRWTGPLPTESDSARDDLAADRNGSLAAETPVRALHATDGALFWATSRRLRVLDLP